MAAQYPVGVRMGEYLHHAVRVVGGQGPAAGCEGEYAGLVGRAIRLQLLLGLAHCRHLGVGVDHRGNTVVVHLGGLAGDTLGHHDTLFRALVSQHRTAHHIANGKDVGGLGFAVVIDENVAAFIQGEAAVTGEQFLGAGLAAHRHDQPVEGFGLVAVGRGVGHLHRALLDPGAGDTGSQAYIQALLLENPGGLPGDLHVHHGQELVQCLEHDHLGAQPVPDAAQFQADDTRPDNPQARGYFPQFQGAGRIDDVLVIDGRGGDLHRHGARGNDHVARVQHLHVAVLVGHFHTRPGQDLARARYGGDAVVLEQPGYAAGQLLDDLFLALQHGRHIDFGALDRNAVHRQVIPCLGELVTAVQQRLGGDTAYIEAGATQADLALVIQPLLDTGH